MILTPSVASKKLLRTKTNKMHIKNVKIKKNRFEGINTKKKKSKHSENGVDDDVNHKNSSPSYL